MVDRADGQGRHGGRGEAAPGTGAQCVLHGVGENLRRQGLAWGGGSLVRDGHGRLLTTRTAAWLRRPHRRSPSTPEANRSGSGEGPFPTEAASLPPGGRDRVRPPGKRVVLDVPRAGRRN